MNYGVKVIKKLYCESHQYQQEYGIGDDIRLLLKSREEYYAEILDIQDDYIILRIKFNEGEDTMKVSIDDIHTIL